MKESEKPRLRYKVGKRLFDTKAEARYYKKAVLAEQKIGQEGLAEPSSTLDE